MKPSWNPDLFESINYLEPFIILHKKLWREYLNSKEQLHDFLIQATRKIPANEILHIPQILASVYIGPSVDGSDHLLPRIIKSNNASSIKEPLVSIIIPTRDQGQLLKKCINSIYERTTYKNFEIIIIDHQSEEKKAKRVIDSLKEKSNTQIEKYSGDFNFSAMVNQGAEIARGEIIVLLNNDTEIIEGNWLNLLVTQTIRKDIGVCGPLLLFKNRTIQHAGIHPSENGLMIHGHKHEKENSPGYFGHLLTKHEVMAVTGACLSTKKTTWDQLGGFNDKNLQVAYNDVDFCLKAREAGLRVLLEPKVKIIHHESASRGVEREVFRNQRLQKEISYMKERWGEFLFLDPASSPNLLLNEEGISLNPHPKEMSVWKR
jgi:GT2 family glycosyltransferase